MFLAELTPVSSVNVDYDCTTKSATVSWTAVLGADSYVATVTPKNGSKTECTSRSTSCQLSALDCGQLYEAHVTPLSGNCKNLVNTSSVFFQTGEIEM